MQTFDVAVIGAGWSGLACALACADAGARVALIEAAGHLGGRARRQRIQLGDQQYTLDNGQHLLIGAYSETARLMRRVGVDLGRALHQIPLALIYPDGFRFRASRLPAPLNLATALITGRGLSLADRLALIKQVRAWQKMAWLCAPNTTALATLSHSTPTLNERLFEPLCLAALNLRLAQASGQIFLRVLQDSLGKSRRDSEFWIPRIDLSELFPDAAQAALVQMGAEIRLHSLATALKPQPQGWAVETRKGSIIARKLVLALPPSAAVKLLKAVASNALDSAMDDLAAIQSAPIASVYLRFDAKNAIRLPAPAMALLENPAKQHYGQWLFDRGALDANQQGIFSVVISGHGEHLELNADALCAAVGEQLEDNLRFPQPVASAAIIEKRATVLATPQLKRPPTALALDGLYLAGDAACNPYPSTLEGSVRSGLQAAHLAFDSTSSPTHPQYI